MISVAIVTNCTAWLTQITALALPLLSAASSCFFNKQSSRREKREKGRARGRGRDWWWVGQMGALWPWSNVYPLNHSKSHLLPSAPHSVLHGKHYLSIRAIIHRWLPCSQQPATMHFQEWQCCVCVYFSVWCLPVWACEWCSKFQEEEKQNEKKAMQVIFCIVRLLCVTMSIKVWRYRGKRWTEGGMRGGVCGKGWRVNQWISIHPLMCASVNKALISFRHISWLSGPLGPSWLAAAARHSLETHLRVYRHLWLVIGNPREINGTMGAASQPSSSPAPIRAHTDMNPHTRSGFMHAG